MTLLCRIHGVEMRIVREGSVDPYTAPLHRCPNCAAEFREAVETVMAMHRRLPRSKKQRTLPPVIMSERWP